MRGGRVWFQTFRPPAEAESPSGPAGWRLKALEYIDFSRFSSSAVRFGVFVVGLRNNYLNDAL